jgi:hypothetical protein
MRRTSWIDQRINDGVAVLLCLPWFGVAFFWRRWIGAMADCRHYGKGEHHQGNVSMPPMPGSALVVIESELVFRGLETVLDRPPMALRPRIACCRQGPGSPAASARIQPVLRCSSPSRPSKNKPAFAATRSCLNNGRIRVLISRSDAAHNASVSSIDAACVHDLRIMVAHGFRNLQKAQL